jgi:hypothetical protein
MPRTSKIIILKYKHNLMAFPLNKTTNGRADGQIRTTIIQN